jgi:hypothetical protein
MKEKQAYEVLDWRHDGNGNEGDDWLAFRCPTPRCQSEGVARSRELAFGTCGRCGAEMEIVSVAPTTSPAAAKQQTPIDLAPKAEPVAKIAQSVDVKKELADAQKFAADLESLVLKRGQCHDDDRNILLMAYWALLFDFHRSVLELIPKPLCGGAFALVRPCMEAVARAHVAVKGTAADIKSLQDDTYRTNLFTIGPWIDSIFGAGDLFTKMFDRARNALHSYTHAGISQLARRYDEHNLRSSYRDGEIIEVIRVCTSAVWMVTNLVTKHLGWNEEAQKAGELFEEWGKHDNLDAK